MRRLPRRLRLLTAALALGTAASWLVHEGHAPTSGTAGSTLEAAMTGPPLSRIRSVTPSDAPAAPETPAARPTAACPSATKMPGRGPRKSTEFVATRILATPRDPWPEYTNAVWCASLAMAWHELGHGQFGGPIRAATKHQVAEHLSKARPVDLDAKHWYAGSGRCEAAVIQRVLEGLCRKFPAALAPPPIPAGEGYFALAYLEAAVRFGHAYRDAPPLRVATTSRRLTEQPPEDPDAHEAWLDSIYDARRAYRAFGVPPGASFDMEKQREQVAILHADIKDIRDAEGRRIHRAEGTYIVDLDRNSAPFELLLAYVPREETLADTWEGAARRLAWSAKRRGDAPVPGIARGDLLTVPCFDWDIAHRFVGLCGLPLANPGFEGISLAEVYQRTKFRLDKAGVEMKSVAGITARSTPWEWRFEPPFLLAMRQRGAERPFLLLWIENEELLAPAGK